MTQPEEAKAKICVLGELALEVDGREFDRIASHRARSLLAWLAPDLAHDIISIAPDPLRTRMYFLGALPARQRTAFLAAAREKLLQHIKEIEAMPRSDPYDDLAIRGAVRSARARIAWLKDVERSLMTRKAARISARA